MDMGYHPVGIYSAPTGIGKQRKNQRIYCRDDKKTMADIKHLIDITGD